MPFWRVFKKHAEPPDAAWWRDADVAAASISVEALERLRSATAAAGDATDDERRAEMIEGLEQLLTASRERALPVIPTGHRVIGDDVCHLIAPVTVPDSPVAGKLFVTSARIVFSSGGVKSWAWHRVREIVRSDRDLVVSVAGGEGLHVRCNVYADALLVRHFAERLIAR